MCWEDVTWDAESSSNSSEINWNAKFCNDKEISFYDKFAEPDFTDRLRHINMELTCAISMELFL